MRIFIVTDLEGVAGVDTFYVQTSPDGPGYARSCRLLTAEVNAAVAGFLAGGASDVIVWDGHGPGAVVFEELHPQARLLAGRPCPPKRVWERTFAEADGIAFVGQHAMAGTPGASLAHTMNSRTVEQYTLDGRPIGEFGLWAHFAGAYGVPVFFLSGDDAACREAEALVTGIVTAVTKEGFAANYALSLSKERSRSLIRQRSELALASLPRGCPPPLSPEAPPHVLVKTFRTEADCDAACRSLPPFAVRQDAHAVRYTHDSLKELLFA